MAKLSTYPDVYDLGKIKVALSRDFYQASSKIGRFIRVSRDFPRRSLISATLKLV